jgi:hypothetical protein
MPASREAIGQVRRLRERLNTEAARLVAAAAKLPEAWVAAVAFKGNAGSDRAWARILGAMPSPPIAMDRQRRTALWRLLRPSDSLFNRTDGGTAPITPYVVCSYLLVGLSRGKAVREEGPWGLATSTHALCRLLDRTGFRADPVAAMVEAHDTLLSASAECGRTVLAEREWAVPAGPGGFIATVRGVKLPPDDAIILACAGTWVSKDQLFDNQLAQVAALRFQQPGDALGQGLLLPAGLRKPARIAGDLASMGTARGGSPRSTHGSPT